MNNFNTAILLVEDNIINQEVVREILANHGLTNIDVIDNGEKAVTAVQLKAYDIVLMDIQMPVMDGLEASKRIRKLPKQTSTARRLPIIAMTAHSTDEDRAKSLRAGMNEHIIKPINPKELLNTIYKYLSFIPKFEQQDEQKIPDLPGIDVTDGLNRLQGNWTTYKRLLINFSQNHVKTISSLALQINEQQWQKAKQLSHTLKGSSGNLSIKNLHQLASELEQHCKPGNELAANEQLISVNNELNNVLDGLKQLTTNYDNRNEQINHHQKIENNLNLQKQLKELERLLDVNLNKAEISISDIKKEIPACYMSDIRAIESAYLIFDIDSAKINIRQLLLSMNKNNKGTEFC